MKNSEASHDAKVQRHVDGLVAQEERQDQGIFYVSQILRVGGQGAATQPRRLRRERNEG